MPNPPHAVLSEHFQERMEGFRLHSAVFLTYTFDPAFFERHVLPVFVDIPASHAAEIRLVQLEDALRTVPGRIAVYYDVHGLVAENGSARLDIQRIPVRHQTGIFHPKNVFLLLESDTPEDDGSRHRQLIVASLSANITQAGWWENVEACHVEVIEEGGRTRLRDDLLAFLDLVRRRAPDGTDHAAMRDIQAFLRDTDMRLQGSTDGKLETHFFGGTKPLVEFLGENVGGWASEGYLEVISPYFDDTKDCKPLLDIIERFKPRETRVFLPRGPSGEGLVKKELYETLASRQHVHWGRLPKDVVRSSKATDAADRFVHAKVYRFFKQNPKWEYWFIGSANLTIAAHNNGGNVESGFLVDVPTPQRPDWWMVTDERKPAAFEAHAESEAATAGGTKVSLRFHWDTGIAEAYWDDRNDSPPLNLSARTSELGALPILRPGNWTTLNAELNTRIRDALTETSLFEVHGESENPAMLLVQEEGMAHKPSLLLRLSAADILRYWSLLTPAQRSAFLEAHAPELASVSEGAELLARAQITHERNTVFDRYAGYFHAFGCLEREVRTSLEEGRPRDVEYRLFGRKYDSLGSLLDRVAEERSDKDLIDDYVIVLCARQLLRELGKSEPDFWAEHKDDVRLLDERLTSLSGIRDQIIDREGAELAAFLDWFDRWFLHRAQPRVEVEA